jgi:serine/threonine-protein kinase
VVELYDWGQDGRMPYMAMELVEGVTLERVLADGRLEGWEVCALVSDMAQGLHAVHREGVVHRDLKPSNVMLLDQAGDRCAKLVDFGVARPAVSAMSLTGTRLLGTAHYMSPEQCGGGGVDHRSDLWALAVIAYRALTGYLPFDGSNMVELVECIKLVEHPHASVLLPQLPAERGLLLRPGAEQRSAIPLRRCARAGRGAQRRGGAAPVRRARATAVLAAGLGRRRGPPLVIPRPHVRLRRLGQRGVRRG